MSKCSSDSTKLILAGVGGLIAYAQFGPAGLIILGVVLMLAGKK